MQGGILYLKHRKVRFSKIGPDPLPTGGCTQVAVYCARPESRVFPQSPGCVSTSRQDACAPRKNLLFTPRAVYQEGLMAYISSFTCGNSSGTYTAMVFEPRIVSQYGPTLSIPK